MWFHSYADEVDEFLCCDTVDTFLEHYLLVFFVAKVLFLDHNVLSYHNRPFGSLDEMLLIEGWILTRKLFESLRSEEIGIILSEILFLKLLPENVCWTLKYAFHSIKIWTQTASLNYDPFVLIDIFKIIGWGSYFFAYFFLENHKVVDNLRA